MNLMTHLVAGYPNRQIFAEAAAAMFDAEVSYLEIQLPFTNPMADGPVIYEANQVALKEKLGLAEVAALVNEIRPTESRTRLLLMTYLTPIFTFGLAETAQVLADNGFHGLIVPDLVIGSAEQRQLQEAVNARGLVLVPVVSPLTTPLRIGKITSSLNPGQLVYATARVGTTGESTNLADAKLTEYLTLLQENLKGYELAVGFGIREKAQVEFLNRQGIVAVIGSEIVKRIKENPDTAASTVRDFLASLT